MRPCRASPSPAVLPLALGAFVFLGDMPRVGDRAAWRLAEALPGAVAAAPIHGGRRGYPVLIGRALFAAMLKLRGDRGASGLLDGLGDALRLIETDDPGVLFDVDTPELPEIG